MSSKESYTGRKKAHILVADDESSIRFVLREALESEGHEVTEAEDGDRALEALSAGDFDLAFLDIRMPGPSGLDLLSTLRGTGNDTAVVIITAESTMENAVEAMKRGALDYLVKPFSITEVAALAEKSLATRELQQEVNHLRREVGRPRTTTGELLVGQSHSLLEIFKMIGKVAESNVPVLITGESGTGKELVARAIHKASPRAESPFVAVNAAAIPRELLESELFGHERGAFTGAVEARPGRFREAAGGTLFLDEIGDMPSELQAKLLRAVQSGEISSVGGRRPEHVDVRILAATHRDLDEMVRKEEFREDLLYRLRVVPMHLPALRDRTEDIPVLAEHFVTRYATELVGAPRFMAENTVRELIHYEWPGNVRELENAIKRALVMSSGGVLAPEDFSFLTDIPAHEGGEASLDEHIQMEIADELEKPNPTDLYRSLLERVERPLLEAVLARTEGNQIRASAILGINRNTLRKKINDLEIELPSRNRT
jgi:two-component system nitrogen regulation response regulator GlnG